MQKKPEGRGSKGSAAGRRPPEARSHGAPPAGSRAPEAGTEGDLRPGLTTAILVARAKAGDASAVDALFERHRALLSHWAHGRLPRNMRDLKDTDDLVQEAMHRALKRVNSFEPRREGSFFAYLCQIIANLIRDEARKHKNLPRREDLLEDIEDGKPTPIEDAIGSDTYRQYRRALQRLPEDQRRAVLMRVELGLSYRDIGEELERPTIDAARLLVSRGLERLSREMNKNHR